MKRIIQTKKDAAVDDGSGNPQNGMIVSGKVTFDELGRVTRQGQPNYESNSEEYMLYSDPVYPRTSRTMRSTASRIITWNEENRVKNIADSGNGTSFLYNDQGERVVKGGGGNETVYLNRFYSLKNGGLGSKHIFAGETRVCTKLEKDGGSIQSGVPGANALIVSQGLQNAILQGNGQKRGINRRLVSSGTGTTTTTNPPIEKFEYFYHGDHLGSSSFITDDAGAVYQHLEYFPYGETWVEEGGSGQMPYYRFTGKELDPETGLYYYGARYYDAVLSRWISADQYLGKYFNGDVTGGVYQPANLALYSYAWNNPVILKDPDGNQVMIPPPLAGAALPGFQATTGLAASGAVGGGYGAAQLTRARLGGYRVTQLDYGPPPLLKGAWGGFKELVTHPGQALDTAKQKIDNIINSVSEAIGVPAKYDPDLALRQGGNPDTVVPDSYTVVRGGTSPLPDGSFSGSAGATMPEAAGGVPHGSIRTTTAGEIRAGGGTVTLVPELTKQGNLNTKHVDVTLGESNPFGGLAPNPVPKADRIQ